MGPATVVVRRASSRDAWALAGLRAQWREESHGVPSGSDATFVARFSEWFESQLRAGSVAWVAEDTATVGMLVMFVHQRMPEPGRDARRWGYIGNVFVHPGRRDHRIGRSLLDAAVDHARREDFARLVLNPSPRSIPFYQRAGFTGDHALLTLELG